MPAGRPREITPDNETVIEWGKELVAWTKANDPTHISMWWATEKRISKEVWGALIQLKEFRVYYEEARRIVGDKYLSCRGVDKGMANRMLSMHFPELRKHEMDELRERESIKREATTQALENLADLLDKGMDPKEIKDFLQG